MKWKMVAGEAGTISPVRGIHFFTNKTTAEAAISLWNSRDGKNSYNFDRWREAWYDKGELITSDCWLLYQDDKPESNEWGVYGL